MSGSKPAELGNLSNLERLTLQNSDLSGSIPTELSSLSNLAVLYLSDNQVSGCIPSGLRSVNDNDLASLGLSFCITVTPPPTATSTPTPSEFTSGGSGTASDPYIITDPTDVSAQSIRSHVAGLRARHSVYFQWGVGDRPGSWTVRIDTSPTSHDFDLFGRDDRGTGWDDTDRSIDGDENITISVQSGGHILIGVQNCDGGAPTELTLTIEPPD